MNSLAHVEINASSLIKSRDFYLRILSPLGWKMFPSSKSVGFKAPDNTHLFLIQTENIHEHNGYHRKNIGLNHIAFRARSREEVDKYADFLKQKNISLLYSDCPRDYSKEYGMNEYYAVFFEDPDRIKLEVVFLK